MATTIPKQQRALQLVGPDQLQINENKPVFEPGPCQVLGRIEVAGLCFSDLKLLKQFTGHPRKSEIAAGIAKAVLGEMPHYVPGGKPTVPGHETVVRIVAVGDKVRTVKVGGRYLVQTDYRWLPTSGSASAFGYNFEGALQEYVLMDERVIVAPDGESMLIPVPEDLSSSALALVEPWACVEDAYVDKQRQLLKSDGRMLVVGDMQVEPRQLDNLFKRYGKPAGITWTTAAEADSLQDAGFDDVVYLGSNAEAVTKLFAKVAPRGLYNIVQCGGRFGKPVMSAIGRVHYGAIRIIGTAGDDPADAMTTLPPTAEVRPHDKINIVGAAGPMGTMHVIRALCLGLPGITVFAGDVSDERLAVLRKVAEPLAKKNNVTLRTYNPKTASLTEKFGYTVLMAPIPALVAAAIPAAAPGGIINIFAGIAAHVTAEIDLDAYIGKRLYFIGTSGSTLDDMKLVLKKVVARKLDTDLSVAAVSGLDGAIDGIRAVEKNTMPGKILVYPQCRGLKLTPLTDLAGKLPLDNGQWNKKSEEALLEQFKK
jgi:threonine dehydrogenase-like Zn-dependent dehydrogenase